MTKIQYYSYISALDNRINHSSSPRRYTKPGIGCNKRDRRYKNLHFLVPTVVFQNSRSLREGDAFAGNVGIAPVSGLLKINAGGVFGLMEWSWNAQNSYSAAYPSTASRRPHVTVLS